MAMYRRKLRKNPRRSDFLFAIPPAVVRGMGWQGGDLLELVDKPEDGIIVIKLANGGDKHGYS